MTGKGDRGTNDAAPDCAKGGDALEGASGEGASAALSLPVASDDVDSERCCAPCLLAAAAADVGWPFAPRWAALVGCCCCLGLLAGSWRVARAAAMSSAGEGSEGGDWEGGDWERGDWERGD